MAIIGAFGLAERVKMISQDEFIKVKAAMSNIISVLEKYKNMYHKEYIHHMDYKENFRKADARARNWELKYMELKDQYEVIDESLEVEK